MTWVALQKAAGGLEWTGGALDRTCVALQRTGGTLQRTGGALDKTGVALQRTAVALQRTGGALYRSGVTLMRTGGAQDRAGVALQMTGDPPDRTGGAIERSRHVASLEHVAAHIAGPLIRIAPKEHLRPTGMCVCTCVRAYVTLENINHSIFRGRTVSKC